LIHRRPEAGKQSGFTLIEVIIVVVIVGILVSIALPGYQESMRKGRRADAKSALMDAANRQERLMLDRSRYTQDMVELGYGADPMISEEGWYSIDRYATTACPVANTNCYALQATPVAGGAQAGDSRCTALRLDNTGAKTATGSAADECW
jgi:type IV pilus assembly protein PilE